MSDRHHRHSSGILRLRAGERRVVQVPPGSGWTAVQGDVRVTEPPRWLGERVVRIERTLQRGSSLCIEQAGWITLHAPVDAVLFTTAPSGGVSTGLGAAVWRIIRSTRRALTPA